MVNINQISVINAIVFSNIFIILFIFLSKKKHILANTSLKIFGVIICLFFIRIILPVEFKYVTEIVSFSIIPLIIDFLTLSFNINFLNHFKVPLTYQNILLLVWGVGILITTFKKFYSYYCLIQQLSYVPTTSDNRYLNVLSRIKKKLNYKFDVKLIISDSVPLVMEFGYFKQTILLPDTNFSDVELEYILMHELNHFANKSNWIKLILTIINCILWWNPLIILFSHTCDELLEIYCDYGVTKDFEFNERKTYLSCLLKNVKNIVNQHYICNQISYLSRNSEHKTLKTRFQLVLEHKRNKKTETKIVLIAILVFLSTYTVVFQPEYKPSPEDFEMPIFSEDNSYVVYENGVYNLYYQNELFIVFNDVEEMKLFGVEKEWYFED